MNDYDTPYLYSMAFPNLFPHVQGDVTKLDRLCLISTQEANYHLLWYCVEVNGELMYPFVGHSKWMYWVQNTSERHRLNQLKQVYQKLPPEHTGMEMEELRMISFAHDEADLRRVASQMQMFNANILRSDSYSFKKKKEVEGMMQAQGLPTLWSTFSAADNHWLYLHALGPTPGVHFNHKERLKLREKWVRQNPHVVDAYFFHRVKFMVEKCFGVQGLKMVWVWFRIELQARGTARVHGC